jgi:hypothetical protein
MSDSHDDSPNKSLRDHLHELLKGGGAHLDFDKAITDLPAKLRGAKAPGLPHTVWQLVEHLRLAQWDILEFSRDKDHVSPPFHAELKAMQDLVADPKTDLYAKLPWGDGQTVLREALLVADHNAYHVAQIVMVRQALEAWKG